MARWRGGGVAAGGGAVPGRRLRPSSWRRRRRRRRRERRRRRRRCAAKRRRPVLRRHDNVDGACHSQRHGKQRLKQRTAAQRHGKAQQATLLRPPELQARDAARQFIIKMTINKETRDQAWTADNQRRQGMMTAASGRRIVPFEEVFTSARSFSRKTLRPPDSAPILGAGAPSQSTLPRLHKQPLRPCEAARPGFFYRAPSPYPSPQP